MSNRRILYQRDLNALVSRCGIASIFFAIISRFIDIYILLSWQTGLIVLICGIQRISAPEIIKDRTLRNILLGAMKNISNTFLFLKTIFP